MLLEEGAIGVARVDSRDIRRIKERALLRGTPALLCTYRFCHTHEEILRHFLCFYYRSVLPPPRTPQVRARIGKQRNSRNVFVSVLGVGWEVWRKAACRRSQQKKSAQTPFYRYFFACFCRSATHTREVSVVLFLFLITPLRSFSGPRDRGGAKGARARTRGGRGGAQGEEAKRARRRGGRAEARAWGGISHRIA